MQNFAMIWLSLFACLAVIGVAGFNLPLVVYLLNTLFLYLYVH
ncbi:MAG: hypothetical protein QG662_70 [Pseudomonadota bacterium]|nr:hypothetical protein [Pseudomonadota bacterium]